MEAILENIFIVSAVQGLLLCVFLFTKRDNHTANVILAAAVLAMSIDLLQAVYYMNAMYFEYPHFMGISYSFPYVYGPIFYLYAKTITSQDNSFNKRNFFHFIPALFVFLYTIPVLLSSAGDKIEFLNKVIPGNPPADYAFISSLMPFHGVLYTVMTVNVITVHNKNIKESFSNIDRINLEWLRIIMLAMIIIWGLVCISTIIEIFFFNYGNNLVVPLAISILIYTIGYMGLKQPEIFRIYKTAQIDQPEAQLKEDRYKKSGLKDEEADYILQSAKQLMEKERLYLDSELTIRKLAEALKIPQHNLSEVINTRLNQNFYDFVNRYRVEEVKQKLSNPEFSNLNFLGIAFEAGFKSKTSFNNIFKKHTGLTPTQYRENSQSQVLQQG